MADSENSSSNPPVPESPGGGDTIHIESLNATVVNIGRGSVSTGPVAQGNLIMHSPPPPPPAPAAPDHEEFAARMDELRAAIQQARTEGALSPEQAEEALQNLDEAAETYSKAVREGDPAARGSLLSSLGFISDILDTAANLIGPASGAISTAVPILALLVKVASRLF